MRWLAAVTLTLLAITGGVVLTGTLPHDRAADIALILDLGIIAGAMLICYYVTVADEAKKREEHHD